MGQVDVRGRVLWRSTGQGARGVLVSNGREIVETADDGSYSLPVPPRGDLVFITVPHGAACERFYASVDASSPGGSIDFWLDPLDPADPRASAERIRFVHVTDLHLTACISVEELAANFALVAQEHPASEVGFLVATGDLTDRGTEPEFEAYVQSISRVPYPVHQVPGNHDYMQPSRDANYRKYLGPPYYSFEAGPAHFVCYDTPGEVDLGPDYVARKWLIEDLRRVPAGRPIVILTHFPPDRSLFDDIKAYNVKAIFSGHWHGQRVYREGDITSWSTPTFAMGGIEYTPKTYRLVTVEVGGEGGVAVETSTYHLTREGIVPAQFPKARSGRRASGAAGRAADGLTLLWRQPLPERPALLAAPVVAGESLLVSVESLEGPHGGVVSLSREDGSVRWYAELGGQVKGSPAAYGEYITATTIAGHIHCLRLQDGSVAWRRQLDNPLERWIYHAGRIIEASVIAGSAMHLVRLDLVSGEPHWERRDPKASDWICSPVAPAYGDGRLYVGFFWQPTGILALDFASGQELWRDHTGPWIPSPSSSPLFHQGRVYYMRHTGEKQVRCVDAATGETLWSADVGYAWCPVQPLAVGELIIVTVPSGKIAAFAAATGEPVWAWNTPGGSVSVGPYHRGYGGHIGGPAVAGDTLAVAGLDGSLTLLDPETGSVVRQWPAGSLGQAPITAPIAVDGGKVYVADLAGELSCWRIDSLS